MEHWVVETISAGLIVAKMDQVRSTVVVSGCLEREFGKEQLGRLQGSLEGWAAGCSIPNSDSRQMTECLAELSSRPGWDARLCRWAGGERARAVPHMKTFTRAGGDEGTSAPWVVMGSHNFSKVERRGAAYTRLPHPTSPFLLLPPALCPARFPHPSHLAFLPLPHSSPSPLPHRRPPGARSRARCCAR